MSIAVPDIDAVIREAARRRAQRIEDACGEAARAYLPGYLKWLVGHPRLLTIAYGVWPRWRPTLRFGSSHDEVGPRLLSGPVYITLPDGSVLEVPT